jgi:hypothetical protein
MDLIERIVPGIGMTAAEIVRIQIIESDIAFLFLRPMTIDTNPFENGNDVFLIIGFCCGCLRPGNVANERSRYNGGTDADKKSKRFPGIHVFRMSGRRREIERRDGGSDR